MGHTNPGWCISTG